MKKFDCVGVVTSRKGTVGFEKGRDIVNDLGPQRVFQTSRASIQRGIGMANVMRLEGSCEELR